MVMEEKKSENSFFKSSKLSKTADQLWNESKSNFKAEECKVQLNLGKTLADDKKGCSSPSAPKDAPVQTKYVFGSNIAERAAKAKLNKATDGDDLTPSTGGQSTSEVTENADDASKGTQSRKTVTAVFEAIRQKECSSSFCKKDTDSAQGGIKPTSPARGFAAVSKQASSSNVRPASKTNVFTGEEDEKTLSNIKCNLHRFDVEAKKWIERGLVELHINRCPSNDCCRIVGRSVSNQLVILNSRISSSTIVEKISTKRVKFSASTPDSSLPLMFLSTTSETVAEQFFQLLSDLKRQESKEPKLRRKRRQSSSSSNDECSKKAPVL